MLPARCLKASAQTALAHDRLPNLQSPNILVHGLDCATAHSWTAVTWRVDTFAEWE